MLSTEEIRLKRATELLNFLKKSPPPLPYEPTLIPMLFTATREGTRTSMKDIARLVEKSPKLAAKVLSVANSAIYSPPSPITGLTRAISLLGFNEMRSLLVMVGAISVAENISLPIQFDSHSLWKHQIHTAAIAKALTIALGDPEVCSKPLTLHPDEAYATGLLHDIGIIFLAAKAPDIWHSLHIKAQGKNRSISDEERLYWGIDHGTIAACVLTAWGLPDVLCGSIAYHHTPYLAGQYTTEASILAAADILAHNPPDISDGQLADDILALLPCITKGDFLALAVIEACTASGADIMISNLL